MITNLAGQAALVEVCPTSTNRCEHPPDQFSVPAYGSLNVPNPDYVAPDAKPESADPYASLRAPYTEMRLDTRPEWRAARRRRRQALSGAQAEITSQLNEFGWTEKKRGPEDPLHWPLEINHKYFSVSYRGLSA